jgi:ankyrin repeat protein
MAAGGVDDSGVSVLMYAVMRGQAAVVRVLLDPMLGLDINYRSSTGQTAFLMAAMAVGGHPIIRMMALAGADVNAKNREGESALSLAMLHYLPESIRAILECPQFTGINEANARGIPPFLGAIGIANVSVLRPFTQSERVDWTVEDAKGRNAAHWAVLTQDIAILKAVAKLPGIAWDRVSDDGHLPISLALRVTDDKIIGIVLQKLSQMDQGGIAIADLFRRRCGK